MWFGVWKSFVFTRAVKQCMWYAFFMLLLLIGGIWIKDSEKTEVGVSYVFLLHNPLTCAHAILEM